MQGNYLIEVIFAKSKPLIIITFEQDTQLVVKESWKKKFKKIDDRTYHIATVIIKSVFEENPDILGDWNKAKLVDREVGKYYGFTKIKGAEVHSLELSKRFINDWMDAYTKLFRYTINSTDDTKPPIIRECLYDAGIYSDGEVGDITAEEIECLRRVINPNGEIIENMKKKLAEQNS